jgi:hypothetical protein
LSQSLPPPSSYLRRNQLSLLPPPSLLNFLDTRREFCRCPSPTVAKSHQCSPGKQVVERVAPVHSPGRVTFNAMIVDVHCRRRCHHSLSESSPRVLCVIINLSTLEASKPETVVMALW